MFKRWVKTFAFLTTCVLANPLGLLAQSIPPRAPIPGHSVWQPPVHLDQVGDRYATSQTPEPFLQVQYVEPLDVVTVAEGGHAHQIIRAPRIEYSGRPYSHLPAGHRANSTPVTTNAIHPIPRLLDHHVNQAPPAAIPDASHQEIWKSPYSYGFFGASGSRQWTRHYGYRDRSKEWRLGQ